MTWLRRFGAFWYDFLVGDRWELFVGPIAVLVLVAALVATGASTLLAGAVLFLGIVGVGVLSVANVVG
jgi:hypothetical protein